MTSAPASDWYRTNGGVPAVPRLHPAEPQRPRRWQIIYVTLTDREVDVLEKLMMDGADNKTIARRLELSIETVKTHMRSILSKTDLSHTNRTVLALAVARQEVVVLDSRRRVREF